MKTSLKTLKALLEVEDEIPDHIRDWVTDFEAELRSLKPSEICKLHNCEFVFNTLKKEILG